LARVVIEFGPTHVVIAFMPDSVGNLPPIHFELFTTSDDPDDPTLAADWWKKPKEETL
jgi:hypothetical protein